MAHEEKMEEIENVEGDAVHGGELADAAGRFPDVCSGTNCSNKN